MNVNTPSSALQPAAKQSVSSRGATGGMGGRALKMEIIDTEADLDALKPGWEGLQTRDPDSGVFMSWDWLSRAFRQNPYRWRVFAVLSGENHVCIFPVKYRVHWSKTLNELQSEMEAGGRLLWSEYSGFLCDPDYEEDALVFLAQQIAELPWAKLSLRYEPTATRAKQFMNGFPEEGFRSKRMEYRISKGQTDNLVSPQVTLPGDFETFLQESLSKSTREKVRRSFRRLLDTGELRITETSGDTFDRDVEVLLDFWIAKWTDQKGSETANRVAGNYRKILETALELDILFMPVLWRGDQPLGALGHIADLGSRVVHFVVAGRDTEAEKTNIGLILHAYSIRWAIECGFKTYDFCHGNESYKYSFGAKDKQLNYFSVRRRSSSLDVGFLDPICTGEALNRAIEFIDSGKSEEASAACRQILFDCI